MLTAVVETARAAQLRNSSDDVTHLRAHAAWLCDLPFCLTSDCRLMRQHVTRIRGLGFEARASRQGKAVPWDRVNTIAELKELTPDRDGFLKAVPYWLKPMALAHQLGCGPLEVVMWPSLMRKAVRKFPGSIALVAASMPQVETCLGQYLEKFGVAPRPHVLIKELMRTLPAEQRPAEAAVDSSDGDTELEDGPFEKEVGGGGAPVGKRGREAGADGKVGDVSVDGAPSVMRRPAARRPPG